MRANREDPSTTEGARATHLLIILTKMAEAHPEKTYFTMKDIKDGYVDSGDKKPRFAQGYLISLLQGLEGSGFIDLDRNEEGKLIVNLLGTKRDPMILTRNFGQFPVVTRAKKVDLEEEQSNFGIGHRTGPVKSLGLRPGSFGHYELWKMRYQGDKYSRNFPEALSTKDNFYRPKMLQKLVIMGLAEPVPPIEMGKLKITEKGKSVADKLNLGKSVLIPRKNFSEIGTNLYPDWKPYVPRQITDTLKGEYEEGED